MGELTTGTMVKAVGEVTAFVPDPLPRTVNFTSNMVSALSAASAELGGLRGIGASPVLSPMQGMLTGPMLRREATASSRIEGTRTNLGQLLLFEATEEHVDSNGDAVEVANYLRALEYGLGRPAERPITAQLIRELHTLLLRQTRGQDMNPGEFRKVQNWIGHSREIREARYVPPPPTQVDPFMEDLVSYIGDAPPDIPALVRVAMIHYQFEAIHPFLDGNGRVGRLLVSLLLAEWDILPVPLLSLSEVLEARRREYVDGLLSVSRDEDWDGWIDFFLTAVADQAIKDRSRVERLLGLRETWRTEYQAGRSLALLKLVDFIIERPIFSAGQASQATEYTVTTTQKAIDQMMADGLLREMTGQRRNRIYIADEVMQIVMPSP